MALYIDANAQAPHCLHFFEISIRGLNTKGETLPLYGELVAVREDLGGAGADRFAVIPADYLLDLPGHPSPPESIPKIDPAPAADFLKGTYQTERRQKCQEERQHFVEVCRDYLQKSYNARLRAAQDRVMALRARETGSPEVAIARQRAENDLADLERSHKERLAGLERLAIARPGPSCGERLCCARY